MDTNGRIFNLTPHSVELVAIDGTVYLSYEPQATPVRVEQTVTPSSGEYVDNTLIHETTFGAPINLPEPQQGYYLIVSLPVIYAAHLSGRTTEDLLIPTLLMRDNEGRIIGCGALSRVRSGQ